MRQEPVLFFHLEREIAQRLGVVIDNVHQRIVHLLGLFAALTARKEQQVVGHHLGDMTLVAFLIFPSTALQATFNINLGTFVEDALSDISQTTPAHHIVPFSNFYSFVVSVTTVLCCGERERSLLHRRGSLGGESDFLWFFYLIFT